MSPRSTEEEGGDLSPRERFLKKQKEQNKGKKDKPKKTEP
jgi:hypothetical protein